MTGAMVGRLFHMLANGIAARQLTPLLLASEANSQLVAMYGLAKFRHIIHDFRERRGIGSISSLDEVRRILHDCVQSHVSKGAISDRSIGVDGLYSLWERVTIP